MWPFSVANEWYVIRKRNTTTFFLSLYRFLPVRENLHHHSSVPERNLRELYITFCIIEITRSIVERALKNFHTWKNNSRKNKYSGRLTRFNILLTNFMTRNSTHIWNLCWYIRIKRHKNIQCNIISVKFMKQNVKNDWYKS